MISSQSTDRTESSIASNAADPSQQLTPPQQQCACSSQDILDRGACREFQLGYGREFEESLARQLDAGNLYQCNRCSLCFRSPSISAEDANRLYGAMPTSRWAYGDQRPASWDLIFQSISQLQGGSLLDVGSFDGQFLQLLPERWQRHAIEPSSEAIDVLQSLGVDVVGQDVDERIASLDSRFDVITMIDVFEHLPNPIHALGNCVQYLKPGGLLFVSTGNSAHWSWRRLEGQHPYLITPQHIRFASPKFFRRWCDDENVRLSRIHYHPHRRLPSRHRALESLDVLYFASRRRRFPFNVYCRLAHLMPYGRKRLHSSAMGSVDALHDHLLAVIQRPSTPQRPSS